jgi:mannitol/fructose-specific phosphotransferase system IIA component (Ntr-type)
MTMQQLQTVGANMAIVMEGKRQVGLISLEDILEEVVGRIEDEFPRLPRLFLKDTLTAGGVVLNLDATTPEQAIRTLAAAIPSQHLPPGLDVAALAIERELQMATDVGHGVAIPHARCPGLVNPLMVFGRPVEGIVFSADSTMPVRLIFLLVTPAERPNVQVFFLAQLASVAQSELVRERLCRAETPQEVIDIIAAADPAVTG